jgi:hypothetical protein
LRFEKKVIATLPKCYSLAEIQIDGEPHILFASEKQGPCRLYDLEGREKATVWEKPGGTMSIVPLPWMANSFLATHRFYSPNDASEANIVLARAESVDRWTVKTLVDLPFVHRFDVLERGGVRYLIACTIKSEPEPKDAWRTPGKIHVAELPDDLDQFGEKNQLPLQVLRDDLFKNHGYSRVGDGCLIASEQGVLRVTPPPGPGGRWEEGQLLDEPSSDAILLDLDGDGEMELAAFHPFHGDTLKIYKRQSGGYVPVYELEEPAPFLHALYGGPLGGVQAVVYGYRHGKRDLVALYYDHRERRYKKELIDGDCGAANVMCRHGGAEYMYSANREIDEAAVYRANSRMI